MWDKLSAKGLCTGLGIKGKQIKDWVQTFCESHGNATRVFFYGVFCVFCVDISRQGWIFLDRGGFSGMG